MASVHKRMTAERTAGLSAIASALRQAVSATVVADELDTFGDVQVALLSFEKYFFRTGSYAGLTVYLADDGAERLTARILGFGGGEGLLNISWGANANFAAEAERILRGFGFR